jgi:hypothetical protein
VPESAGASWERRAELAWKWALRIVGLYVFITESHKEHAQVYVLIGSFGAMGLPTVYNLALGKR